VSENDFKDSRSDSQKTPEEKKPVAQGPAKKKKTHLDLAPLQLAQAICSDCGSRMACVPRRDNQGRIDRNLVKFFCDKCECGFEAQLIYFNGQSLKYENPKERSKEV
jgi:hypothetical protein